MPIGAYISIITLNVNGLNTPPKDAIWLNGYKTRPTYMLSTRHRLQTQRNIQTESERMEKDIPHKWKSKESGVAIVISDKIDNYKEYYKR